MIGSYQSVTCHYDRNQAKSTPRQIGFTLIEMMIGMGLGLTVVAGLITVFQGNKQSSELNQAMADMQENVRYAFDALGRDIRMAGFQGCALSSEATATIKASDAPTSNFYLSSLSGSHVGDGKNWEPVPPPTFKYPEAIEVVANTDALSIQFGNQELFNVQAMSNSSSDVVLDALPETIAAGDYVLISNCQTADLFRVTAINNATLKHDSSLNQGSATLSTAYGQGDSANLATLMKFEANVYFLANTGRKNQSGDDITSLYRQTLPFDSPPQEMVEGVEQFRIKFGIREEKSDDLQWGSAKDVAGEFEKVQSVQIGLLMASYERLLPANDAKSYFVAGDLVVPETANGTLNTPTHAADKRFRLSFNTTINVRNRR